jgi:Peptidase family M28
MTTEGNRGVVLALLGFAMLLAATLLAYRPPAARGLNAPPTAFSASRTQAILKDLVGNGLPHPIGSAANAQVRDIIVKRLENLGYAPELQTGFVCNDRGECGTATNIVATLEGSRKGCGAILLAAHYDSVASGPGASDDGAGVASVLEIARILKTIPAPPHPIVLLVTDGEEAGLLGALLFVRQHPLAKQVQAAVNLDARGVSGPSLMFETGTANSWLMHLYAAAMRHPITNSLYYVVYKSLPNDTDFTVFKAASYQGFNFAFVGDVAYYHTPLDTWANASSSTLQHQGDNALAAVLALANSMDSHPPVSESVFFDVFGRSLIMWPVHVALPAALAMLALLLGEAALLFRFCVLDGRQAIWGAIGAGINLVLGAVLSVAAVALLLTLGKLPPIDGGPWIAHPLPMNIASASMALLTAGLVSIWIGRRAGFWGFWLGATLLIAALSVGTAAMIPGASFVLLLTALAAGLAPLPYLFRFARGRPSRGMRDFAALFPGFVIITILLPILLLMYSGLGALAWPISTVALCFATSLLLPLLAIATRAGRQLVILLCAAITLGGIISTLFLPTYSARWPQRLNIEYWWDADHSRAHWWAQPASLHLPAALAAAVRFDPLPGPRFAGSGQLGFFADAPKVSLAAPELTQLTATPLVPGRTHYRLRLRSARGAGAAFAVFPAAANIEEIIVSTPSGPLHAKLQKMLSGATRLGVVGAPAAGLEFEIDAATPLMTVQVFDESYGLPEELPQGRALQAARPRNATSSQDGDITVVQSTVSLNPAAGR